MSPRYVVIGLLLGCGARTGLAINSEPDAALVPDAQREPGSDASIVDAKDVDVRPTQDGGAADAFDPCWCVVSGPGHRCGMTVTITPFVKGGPFGGFQDKPGTGGSGLIRIDVSDPVFGVRLTALDPDFPDRMRALAGDATVLGLTTFDFDSKPGAFTTSTKEILAAGITQVVLEPSPLDYVAYDALALRICP